MVSNIRLKKSDETRSQLMDAALRVIGRKGYTSATVDEIVREAGVSKGVAYYHFKNKADMAISILDRGLEYLITDFRQIASEAPDAPTALNRMLGSFVSLLYDNREFAQFFMTELWREGRVWSDDMRKMTEKLVEVIADQLRRGQKDGIMRTDLDPSFATVSIVGLVLTDTMYYVGDAGDPLISREDFVERICDFVRHAIVAPGLLH